MAKYGPSGPRRFRRTVAACGPYPACRPSSVPFVPPTCCAAAGAGRSAALTRRRFSTDRQLLRVTVIPRRPARRPDRRLREPDSAHAGCRGYRLSAGRRARRRARIQPGHHRNAAHRHRGRVRGHLPAADGGLPQPADSPQKHCDEQPHGGWLPTEWSLWSCRRASGRRCWAFRRMWACSIPACRCCCSRCCSG